MRLRMWTYDLAREQAPSLDHLRRMLDVTREAGFNAFGLYAEHRFAYPSTPWAHGVGCVTPDMVRTLQKEYADIQIIPCINLLGHFEGMLYTEYGKRFAEEVFQGMQACPSKPEFVELCEKIIDDTLGIFDTEIIHIGGDETWQLGKCARCSARVASVEDSAYEEGEKADGKAHLYGSHFGPLAERVVQAGRRPAVWGDMFLDHPTALDFMPKETLIFDWQYFGGCRKTSQQFLDRGFEVVGCPTLHTYNATWFHIAQSEQNMRQVTTDAVDMGLHGVCMTTWECALMGSYDLLLPALRGTGEILRAAEAGERPGFEPEEGDPTGSTFLKAYLAESERLEEWARLMGVELQACGGKFAFSGIRSSLKVRLLLNANPFLAWLHHHEELTGEVGDRAMALFDRAMAVAPDEATKGVTLFARSAVEFVRLAEKARQAYIAGNPGEANGYLALTRGLFDDLAKVAEATCRRIGGSQADAERCRIAREHVERVMRRVAQYGDGSLGYLPAFEHLTHHKFVPHDQGAWWLINRWANQ